jgi:hypothetical protein
LAKALAMTVAGQLRTGNEKTSGVVRQPTEVWVINGLRLNQAAAGSASGVFALACFSRMT